MFQKLSLALQRFMYGRNGADQLSWAILIAGLVVDVIASFTGLQLLYIVAYALLLWSVWRMFSKNLEKRRAENQKLLNLWNRLRDRQHRYYSCPQCKQTVRVPRGKGKVNIRCPKCGEQFIKKT